VGACEYSKWLTVEFTDLWGYMYIYNVHPPSPMPHPSSTDAIAPYLARHGNGGSFFSANFHQRWERL